MFSRLIRSLAWCPQYNWHYSCFYSNHSNQKVKQNSFRDDQQISYIMNRVMGKASRLPTKISDICANFIGKLQELPTIIIVCWGLIACRKDTSRWALYLWYQSGIFTNAILASDNSSDNTPSFEDYATLSRAMLNEEEKKNVCFTEHVREQTSTQSSLGGSRETRPKLDLCTM